MEQKHRTCLSCGLSESPGICDHHESWCQGYPNDNEYKITQAPAGESLSAIQCKSCGRSSIYPTPVPHTIWCRKNMELTGLAGASYGSPLAEVLDLSDVEPLDLGEPDGL